MESTARRKPGRHAIHRYLPQKSRQRMGEIPTAQKQSGGGYRSLYILPFDRTVLCGILSYDHQ